MVQFDYQELRLPPPQHLALFNYLGTERSDFADTVPILTVRLVKQPYFRRHEILQVFKPIPPPGRTAYVAWARGSADPLLLSRHLARLNAVAQRETPAGISSADGAREYALHGSFWTEDNGFGTLLIESFADIPFSQVAGPAHEAAIAALQAQVGGLIVPLQVSPADGGYRVRHWLVNARRLLERELLVSSAGQIQRRDTVHAQDLPMPMGVYWGDRAGRMVPIG